MIDLPSCISVDMYENRPDLGAMDSKGNQSSTGMDRYQDDGTMGRSGQENS